MICLSAIILAYFVSFIAGKTQITTFTDGACKTSKQYFDAVNGYPDGACMNIASASATSYGSFMVDSVDSGCGVTIYGNDSSILSCSAKTIEVASEITCYNSSWIYLSVDNCANSSTSSTSSAASASGTSSARSRTHTGAIVGSIVGSIAALTVVLGAGYLAYRRRHRGRDSSDQPAAEADQPMAEADQLMAETYGSGEAVESELPSCSQIHELEDPKKLVEAPNEREMAEMEARLPVEMEAPLDSGRNAIFIVNR